MNQLTKKANVMTKINLSQPQMMNIYRLILIVSVVTNLILLAGNYKLDRLYDMTINNFEQEISFSNSYEKDI